MERTRSSNAASNKLVLLILLIVLVAAIIIAAVILSAPREEAASPRKLKANTLVYEPITDVEVARNLVVHPGAQLHGFRFRVDDTVIGIHAFVEVWENGTYRGMSGATGGELAEREGYIRCSFGMRDDRTGVDWCIGQPPGATYRMQQQLPEGFVPSAWTSGALYMGDTGKAAVQEITPDVPLILAALAVSDTGSIMGIQPEQLMADPELIKEYRYIQIFKCEFYTTDEWPQDEVYLGVLENGKELHMRDISQLPERDAVENAISAYMMISSAWPGRDISTLPQAVYIRMKLPISGADGPMYQEYYAFRLEDGTPVLQSQSANQFSTLDPELYVALLEAALRYTPEG